MKTFNITQKAIKSFLHKYIDLKINILKTSITLSLIAFVGLAWGQYSGSGTFEKITSINDLDDGYYVIVNSGDGFAMNSSNAGKFFTHTAVTPSSGSISNPAAAIVWKIEANGGGYTIYNESSAKYVSYTGSSNEAHAVNAVSGDAQRWTITYASNVFTFANKATTTRILQYNSSSPRFACYTSAQQKLFLYKLSEDDGSGPCMKEDFSNMPANNSSYTNRSWTGTNGGTWSATSARTDQTLDGKAICTSGSGSVTSPTTTGGMGTLSFQYVRAFTGTGARSIEVWVNGSKIGSTITVSSSSDTVMTYSENINIAGNVQLELKTSGAQIKIDNISWTCFEGGPSHNITFNANGGTGSMPDQSIPENTSDNLDLNTFTKTGYVFASWNTSADGSGTTYNDGANYTMG
ncbi:MAG: hypothetical protein GX140_10420, partial [Bacteroidales bacterium]|nr:hypothetical protein [Bacteroidales bacterium]